MKQRAAAARIAFGAALAVLLAGCAGSRPSAPVIDRLPGSPTPPPATSSTQASTSKPAAGAPSRAPAKPAAAASVPVGDSDTYTVRSGDTLYGIALDHGQDYREIAKWNNLDNPNVIRAGQVLKVRPPEEAAGAIEVRPLAASTSPSAPVVATGPRTEPRAVKLPYSDENLALLSREPKPPAVALAKPPALELKPAQEIKPAAEPQKPAAQPAQQAAAGDDDIDWSWPTQGRVAAGFSESTNKGLDITGKAGQPVQAAADGTVLYVGTGIRGYGKLLVIRHNKNFSTVYAHNDNILVKEGQKVAKGQKVAEMGNSDADQVKLHFEIRRLGKPVDPAKLLPAR